MAYAQLKQISISYAIQALADSLVPSGSKDKVLLVPISISATNYKLKCDFRKSFTIVIYRPMNYCFVGMVNDFTSNLEDNKSVYFESYHDSCWRDGIDRMINQVANEIYSEAETKKAVDRLHVFNSFGISGPKIIKGKIIMNDSDRTAFFTNKVDDRIQKGDLCKITSPHDGSTSYDTMKDIRYDEEFSVFYGDNGTRCLLCDVELVNRKDQLTNR